MPQQTTGKIVVISGPSGVGKSTICQQLVKRLNAWLSVSATSRPKTAEEINGRDYQFISKEEFQNRIHQNDFLEHAEVFGNLYGTPKQPVRQALRHGKTVILEIDVHGALQVKEIYPNAIMIFILPPTNVDLAKRIDNRARNSTSEKKTRLNLASLEIALARRHYKHMVINDDLEQAINKTIQIIKRKLPEQTND